MNLRAALLATLTLTGIVVFMRIVIYLGDHYENFLIVLFIAIVVSAIWGTLYTVFKD